jgi:site-specific DNA-methyltransferase (adenine-specific)
VDGAARAENTKLPRFWSPEMDALKQEWRGERVWCNPPYSRTAEFIAKGHEADVAVFLVPARTNARWFHDALAHGAQPRFFPHRLKFKGAESSAPFDTLLMVFRRWV